MKVYVTALRCCRLLQALTIIGLGTAYTNIRLMLFAIWPFGQAIRDQVSSMLKAIGCAETSCSRHSANSTPACIHTLLLSQLLKACNAVVQVPADDTGGIQAARGDDAGAVQAHGPAEGAAAVWHRCVMRWRCGPEWLKLFAVAC